MTAAETAPSGRHGPEALQHELERLLRGRRAIRVLDAGCGSKLHLDLGPRAYVVGIDVSAEALEQNVSLDERIVADIQTCALPPATFDVAICWDVLEHLPRPVLALERLARALKGDGLLVLALPNVLSLKGIVTKLTPYRFHAWAYRRVLGSGAHPFRTYLRLSMSPGSLGRFARRENLEVVYWDAYEGDPQRDLVARSRVIAAAWRGSGFLLKALSLGAVDPRLSEIIVVMRKRSAGREMQHSCDRLERTTPIKGEARSASAERVPFPSSPRRTL